MIKRIEITQVKQSMQINRKEFYTAQDVADKFDLSIMTIYRYIKLGKFNAYKIGREFRIKEEDLERFVCDSKLNK